jgi:hypothetical protein
MFATFFSDTQDDSAVTTDEMERFVADTEFTNLMSDETKRRYMELRARQTELQETLKRASASAPEGARARAELESVNDEMDYLMSREFNINGDSRSSSSDMEVDDDNSSVEPPPLPSSDGMLSLDQERALLNNTEYDVANAKGFNNRISIRKFMESFVKTSLYPSADRYTAKRVQSYYCSLSYVRSGLVIVDTADLYGPSNSKGLGLVTIDPIPKHTFVGFFTGRWELATTVDTVLLETYYYLLESNGDPNPTTERPAPDPKRWMDPSVKHSLAVDCIERYAERFDRYKLRMPKESGSNNASYLYCIPRLAYTETKDGVRCELSVDNSNAECPKFDVMALANHESPANTETFATFYPPETTTGYAAIVSRSIKTIRPGEEVTIDYGISHAEKMNPSFVRHEPSRMKSFYKNDKQQNKIRDGNSCIVDYYKTINRRPPSYAFGPAINLETFTIESNLDYIYRESKQPNNVVTHTRKELQTYVDRWVTNATV